MAGSRPAMTGATVTFVLREAQESDISHIIRLVRGLAEYERLTHRMVATEEDFRRIMFGPKPLAYAVLAEAGGAPVGIALWFWVVSTFAAKPGIYLEDLFVQPSHRGMGIGLALLRRLANIARQNDCIALEWNVLKWNQPAIEFYERIGARPVKDWTVYRMEPDAIAALASTQE